MEFVQLLVPDTEICHVLALGQLKLFAADRKWVATLRVATLEVADNEQVLPFTIQRNCLPWSAGTVAPPALFV